MATYVMDDGSKHRLVRHPLYEGKPAMHHVGWYTALIQFTGETFDSDIVIWSRGGYYDDYFFTTIFSLTAEDSLDKVILGDDFTSDCVSQVDGLLIH